MPYAIPIITYFVEAVLVYVGVNVVVAYLVAIVVAVGLSKLMSKSSLDGDALNQDTPQQILSRGTVNTDVIGYGQSRRSGTMMFLDVSGTNNDYLWQVIHLVGHEVDSIPSIYLDDEEITNAQIDASGNVTSGKFSGRVLVKRYLGTSTQLADPDMISAFSSGGKWTSNDRARGNAYIIVRLKRDDPTNNTETKVFPLGPPNSISAQMRLRKVYDPRLDSSVGGSGTHRAFTPSTWQWSDNPALCARDYLCLGNIIDPDGAGMAEDYAIVNVSELVAAANRCDQLISFPGSVTLKQYTCNGFLRTSSTLAANKEFLEGCMMGRVFYSGGEWHIFAGGYDTPTITLQARDFAGDLSFDTTAEHAERFNEYRAVYQNAVELWRDVECLPRSNSSYMADDGEYLPGTLNLPLTTNEFTAQYISFMTVQQTRNMQRFVATMKPRAIQLRAWDTVILLLPELGWNNKVFRVVQWKLGAIGLPELTFREEDATLWNWAAGNATARTFNDPSTPAVEKPPSPQNFTVTSLPEAVYLKWDSPAFSAFEYIEIYRADESGIFNVAQVINRVSGDSYSDATAAGVNHRYWVIAVNRYGQKSQRVPNDNAGLLAAANSASSQVTFIARGQCVVTGNTIQKVGGVAAYDSDCYSAETFPNGCILSFRANQTNATFVLGLNTDPTSDQDFVSIDFAWLISNDGNAYLYESGVIQGASQGTYTTGDVFSIVYDGSNLTYKKNGAPRRQVVTLGKSFWVDSSFFTPGAKAVGVSLIPTDNSVPFAAYSLIPRGNCQYANGTIQKVGGSALWDSDCYSVEKFSSGCELRFRPVRTTGVSYMMGINSDPTTDQSYTSLDHAWLQDISDNSWYIYENGLQILGPIIVVSSNDVPSIVYDGTYVRYFLTGTKIREVPAFGKTFAFDCSFCTPGATVEKVYFGALTGATPVAYLAAGNASVSNDAANRGPNLPARDSTVYSVKGYPTFHLAFKANSPPSTGAGTTMDPVVGVTVTPTQTLTYTDIGAGFDIYCISGVKQWTCIESGTAVTSPQSWDESTLFEMTGDGTSIRYYVNRQLVRTTSYSGNAQFFKASFAYPNEGINSLVWGPTINRAVVDTPQIGPDAASALASTQPADSGFNFPTYSSGSTFRDEGACASVSWTNDEATAVDVEIRYSGLFTLTGNNPTSAIGQYAFCRYNIDGSGAVTDGADKLLIAVVSPVYATRSGNLVVSVPAGATLNAFVIISFVGPAGTFDPANVNWSGLSLAIYARKR